ncbi:MAG: hypothetical protein WKF75_10620 [Singulisphaera sp.]
MLLTGTFGVLILRLLPPRPRLPRLARQPGFVACVTYLAVAVFTTVTVLVTLQTRGKLGQLKPIDVVAYYMIASELAAHLGGCRWRSPGPSSDEWPISTGGMLGRSTRATPGLLLDRQRPCPQ